MVSIDSSKEFWNPIGLEVHLVSLNQNSSCYMLPFLDEYHQAKNLRYHEKHWRFLQVNGVNVFKNWYYSIINFYQFQHFIAICLCTVEIYQGTFQSNSFNRNYLIALFNWGWSRLINKHTLIRNLNFFASEARISKWSKSIEQLHSSRWSNTANCLALLRLFPLKLDIPIWCATLVKKWRYVLP